MVEIETTSMLEKDLQINIGFGKGKALEIFNSNISTFRRVEY